MSNKALVKFNEFSLPSSELKKLPEEQAAFLALLFCCNNEINILLRTYSLYSSAEEQDVQLVRTFDLGTKLFLARTVSTKVFELIELLEGKKKWQRSDDALIEKFRAEALERLEKETSPTGRMIARALRDDGSSHYSLAATTKNVKSSADDRDYKFYMHAMEGNSFAQLGEDLVFSERFRTGRLPGASDAVASHLGEWLDWTMDVVAWLRKVCFDFFSIVIPDEALTDWRANRVYWLEPNSVGKLGTSQAPLFLRSPK